MICINGLEQHVAMFPVLAKMEALKPQNCRKWPFIEQYSVIVDKRCAIVNKRCAIVDKKNGIVDRRNSIVDKRNAIVNRRSSIVYRRNATVNKRNTIVDLQWGIVNKRWQIVDQQFSMANRHRQLADRANTVAGDACESVNNRFERMSFFLLFLQLIRLVAGRVALKNALSSIRRYALSETVFPPIYNPIKLIDMFKVLINFTTNSYSDAELLVKAFDVIKGVSNNSNFPTPSPTVDEVEAARVAYRDSLAASNSGDHQAVADKNEKRKVLEDLLHDLGMYVNQIGKGDEKILLSSGFDLSKKAEAAGPLDAPENLQVHPAKSKGTVEVTCNRVAHANSYTIEYRNLTTPNGTATAFATRPKVLITGLTSGNQYAFRVLAVGTDPQRNWSDEVNSFVL